MTSFAVAVEPGPQPRLAALALGLHLAAALAPWLVRVPWPAALASSLLALAGLASTLARVPGPQGRLRALAWDAAGCRARLAGEREFEPAKPTRRTRAMPGLVALEVVCRGRRLGWLLSREALPEAEFRRLKARIRLTC